jgi:hypothetical protein
VANIITLPKPSEHEIFPKIYIRSASCPLRANYLRSWF